VAPRFARSDFDKMPRDQLDAIVFGEDAEFRQPLELG
jgi:hypothetical protein